MTPAPSPRDALRLRAEIGRERESLDRATARVAEARARAAASGASWIEHAALGKSLDDVYQATERIFRSIAQTFEGVPSGAGWHATLLDNMRAEVPTLRPAAIGLETAKTLHGLLGFRHVFRHLYGGDLRADRLDALAASVPVAVLAIGADLVRFDEFLERLATIG